MKLYKFSPITNKQELLKAIEYIHLETHKLCKNSFGKYLPNARNIGIFSHYDDEYKYLINLKEELTKSSDNFNQKYFCLHEPIVIPAKDNIPSAIYEFLYIRKPDPYRHHVGDIDFYVEEDEYIRLKNNIQNNKNISGVRIFPSPHLDMIELFNFDSDVLAYVSTKMMTNLVKVTKSEA